METKQTDEERRAEGLKKIAEAKAKAAHSEELILFCPWCFASQDNASWHGELIEGACMNCGVSNGTVKIPRFAVEEIRKQASWVGKRYYPHEEDKELHKERMELMKLVKEFPGRTIEPAGRRRWEIAQKGPNGSTSVTIDGKTKGEAWERAKESLTYRPDIK